MDGSREDLEKRVKAAEKVLRDMEQALESAKKLIEETRRILDHAKSKGNHGEGSRKKQNE